VESPDPKNNTTELGSVVVSPSPLPPPSPDTKASMHEGTPPTKLGSKLDDCLGKIDQQAQEMKRLSQEIESLKRALETQSVATKKRGALRKGNNGDRAFGCCGLSIGV
jgi:hypothetical protein